MALIGKARLLVGCDSGNLHIASALGVPVIGKPFFKSELYTLMREEAIPAVPLTGRARCLRALRIQPPVCSHYLHIFPFAAGKLLFHLLKAAVAEAVPLHAPAADRAGMRRSGFCCPVFHRVRLPTFDRGGLTCVFRPARGETPAAFFVSARFRIDPWTVCRYNMKCAMIRCCGKTRCHE